MGRSDAALRFVDGVHDPEDIALIPGTEWIVTSSLADASDPVARSSFVRTTDHAVTGAYPAAMAVRPDTDTYGDHAPPAGGIFHGLALRPGDDGVHTLFQVNHERYGNVTEPVGRDAIEVFEIDANVDPPTLTWIGAIPTPGWASTNDVCPLPEGGLAVSNSFFVDPRDGRGSPRSGPTGNVLEWHDRRTGWTVVEGTDLAGPNGIAASPDGRWLYVVASGSRQVVRISRSDPHGDRTVVDTPFLGDNLTWTGDGHLLLTGQDTDRRSMARAFLERSSGSIGFPFAVLRIDPHSMATEVIARHDGDELLATTALEVGHEIWIGAARGRRLGIVTPHG